MSQPRMAISWSMERGRQLCFDLREISFSEEGDEPSIKSVKRLTKSWVYSSVVKSLTSVYMALGSIFSTGGGREESQGLAKGQIKSSFLVSVVR